MRELEDKKNCKFLPIKVPYEFEKPAAIFLDFMNLKLSFQENGLVFDMESIVSKINEIIGKNNLFIVYLPYNQLNGKFVQFLSNLGLCVKPVPCKDVDAIIGFDICNSVYRLGIKTLIIGSHDGDFSPIVDEVKMMGCRVIFLCYPKILSALLREKVEIINITKENK